MISKNGVIVNIISNDLSGLIKVVINAKNSNNAVFKIYDGDELFFEKKLSFAEIFEFEVKIDNPKLWSLDHPFLYKFSLEIQNELFSENIVDSFGIRKISTKGKYIEINDVPIFVKGYIRGATAHEHSNNLNCSDIDFYRKNIRTAKSFGFNMVRFHSQIPSEEFFKVADEEGILIHIEMRPPHDLYNNLEEMINTRNDFIKPEFIEGVVNQLFNHPSFAVYCLGNEIKNLSSTSIVEEIATDIKKLDPTRLFLDTCAWGENNRPLVDIDVQHLSYFFPFGKHAGMYDDLNNLKVGDFNKGKEITFNVPLLAHEVCHYTALRDFKNLKEKFTHNNIPQPWWIDEELKMIHEKGYDDSYNEMYKASKEFQLSCWKIAYEEMRSSKYLGGFHFLQFADTDVYENSNGIVDCFDDVNYIEPKRFLDFNGDCVILVKENKINYFDNQIISLPLFISRFDENKYSKGEIRYSLKGKTINYSNAITNVDISKHDFYKIANLEISLPQVKVMERTNLEISLYSGENLVSKNNYLIVVYPRLSKITYKEFVNYKNDNIQFVDNLEAALKLLKEDKDVCLIYRSDYTRHLMHKNMSVPKYSLRATLNRHKPVIWDRGTNYGGIIDQDKFSEFGYGRYYDHSLKDLAEDCDKIILDGVLAKATNLFSGIDKSCRDRFDAYKGSFNLPELMYDRTLRNFSYLFEIKVGKAKLLVVGFNLLGLDNNEPSSNYFAHKLIEYTKTFEPNNTVSVEDFEKYLINSSKEPVKERMMTQFWQLDNEPVETKQYWEESRKYLS